MPQVIVNTITTMRITYDPAKDASNLAKHGVTRDDGRRVISLRKANPREVKRYAKT